MIYIMRHGKTVWNQLHKLQGSIDIPLNEQGREMAREARSKYPDLHFDICYCSPLSRARETAELFLAGSGTPIVLDDRLREMSFGDYEGTENVFEKPDCPVWKLFKDPTHYEAVDNAESFESLFRRTGEFIREVLIPADDAGKRILIVGHGAMSASILSQFRDVPLANFWDQLLGNCALEPIDRHTDERK